MRRLSIFILCMTIVSIPFSFSLAAMLRGEVDQLPGELDIEDNVMEKEITTMPQGFTDLAVTDISISPLYIVGDDTVTVSVAVKNRGSEIAYGAEVSLYRPVAGESVNAIQLVLIGNKRIRELLPGKKKIEEYDLWIKAPKEDGYNLFLWALVTLLEGEPTRDN